MPWRVLVVDDDAAFRALASGLVLAMGLAVAGEAGTVAEGAVLVDIGLPDVDGLVLAQQVAARPWAPRVVITSSDPDAVTDDIARGLGAVAFLPKTELADGSLRELLTGVR
jgi:CheY-like chemotaxis protein